MEELSTKKENLECDSQTELQIYVKQEFPLCNYPALPTKKILNKNTSISTHFVDCGSVNNRSKFLYSELEPEDEIHTEKTSKPINQISDDEKAAKRAKRREYMRNYRLKQLEKLPAEELYRHYAVEAERKRKRSQAIRQNETPEEAKKRRITHTELMRYYREARLKRENVLETARRRAVDIERMRQYRIAKRKKETPEETARILAANAERMRIYRQTYVRRKEVSIDSEKKAKHLEQVKLYQKKKRQNENPEEAEKRKTIHRERMQAYRDSRCK